MIISSSLTNAKTWKWLHKPLMGLWFEGVAMLGCWVVISCHNIKCEAKETDVFMLILRWNAMPEYLRRSVLKEVYFEDRLRHLCDGEEKKPKKTHPSYLAGWDVYLCQAGYHWHQASIKAAHICLMQTSLYSKLCNRTAEGLRRVCAGDKYLLCDSLSIGKCGLCKLWWWNICDIM